MSMQELILSALKASIFLTVLALGFKATLADAEYVFRRPRELSRAFLTMNVFMPLLALAIVLRFNLEPAVKIALVALSVSPVPPLFPRKSMKARGREGYSVGLLVAAAVLAIVVIPLTMKIFEQVLNVPLQMPPRAVAKLVFATILAPLLIGVFVRRLAPSFAERVARPVATFASVLLGLAVLPILFESAKAIVSLIGNGTLLSMTAFGLVGLVVGHLLGGPDPETRLSLALATACRHPGLAIAIAHANFPQQKLVVPAVGLYLIISAVLWIVASARYSREVSREALPHSPRRQG